jgi:hypothetical protein
MSGYSKTSLRKPDRTPTCRIIIPSELLPSAKKIDPKIQAYSTGLVRRSRVQKTSYKGLTHFLCILFTLFTLERARIAAQAHGVCRLNYIYLFCIFYSIYRRQG